MTRYNISDDGDSDDYAFCNGDIQFLVLFCKQKVPAGLCVPFQCFYEKMTLITATIIAWVMLILEQLRLSWFMVWLDRYW